MHAPIRFAFTVAFFASSIIPAIAREKHPSHTKHSASHSASGKDARNPAEIEAATRLQVFLDRANFSPGRIDGHCNDFTLRALALYRRARGEQPSSPPPRPDTTPDLTGLDLASVGSVFIPYLVNDADLQNVGPLPAKVAEQAKLKFLPYRDAAEAIAEKFHCDPRFLEQLNPGRTKAIKAGDQLMVPNVEPFELSAVKAIEPGSDVSPPQPANELGDQPEPQPGEPEAAEKNKLPETAAPPVAVKVDTKMNMLGVYEGEKLVAAYPVTIGSAQTASPIGEWKVRGVAKMPRYRYDERMLKHGERSNKFQMLQPGPNSPVGVIWIALNKKGIGLHGTAEPETIGRAASHGCVRLANWDIVRLAGKVKGGVAVSIH